MHCSTVFLARLSANSLSCSQQIWAGAAMQLFTVGVVPVRLEFRNVYISKNPKSLYNPAKQYKAQKIAISLFRLFFNRKRVSCLGRSGAVPWSRPHVPLQGNTRYSGVFQGTMHLAIAPPVLHESQLPANII